MVEDVPPNQSITGDNNVQVIGSSNVVTVLHLSRERQEQNRVQFLAQLHSQYTELWEQLLQGVTPLTLRLSEKPDVVLHHNEPLFRAPQRPERLLPEGTSIANVYDEVGRNLLILGEAGAGKSTLLLDFARHLVGCAEQDAGHPFPVILPLFSWAVKSPPLTEWLAAQLTLIYDVPSDLSRDWVQKNLILPLLDGLDEVPQGLRMACIKAINTYHREHLVPLVVCSRRTEYEETAQQERLVLNSAVIVKPLTRQQVETYLDHAGPPLAAVRTVLHTNLVLQELTTTPLMLSVLTLTYAGAAAAVQDLPQEGSTDAQQQQIFATYVERMVERKGERKKEYEKNVPRYSLESTQVWLGWLACRMREHRQAVFYLEYLQPDWLAPRLYYAYTLLAVQLPGILIGVLASLGITQFFGFTDAASMILCGVLGGFFGWMFSKESLSEQIWVHRHQGRGYLIGKRIAISVMIGLLVGLRFGLYLSSSYGPSDWLRDGSIDGVVIGLSSLLLQLLSQAISRRVLFSGNSVQQRWKRFVRSVQTVHGQRALLVAAGVGLSIGLSVWLREGLSFGSSTTLRIGLSTALGTGVREGLLGWLSFGLVSILVSLILGVQAEDVHPIERLRWTWGSLMRSLLTPKHVRTTLLLTGALALSTGLSYGLSNGLDDGLNNGLSVGLSVGMGAGLNNGLSVGLGAGLSYWILGGLFQGISSERIEDQSRRVPNQGIQDSLHNCFLTGIISYVVIRMIGTLSLGLSLGLSLVPNYVLSLGLNEGMRKALSYGLSYGLSLGWLVAVCGGLLVCAIYGGLAVLRHYVIRLLLACSRTFPWNAPRFLDDATTRVLLLHIGGGYSFVHRLILDYFAAWDTMPTESALSHLCQAVPSRVCECGYQESRPEARFCASCGKSLV